MNSRVCIDASLALKLVLPESDSDRARALWQKWIVEKVARLAPPLLLSEGLSVIRNRAYRKLLLPEEAEEMSKTFLGLPIHILTPDNLMTRTWELATEFNRPNVYDSHYLALAEKMGCELWTADERLFNSVKDKLPLVRFISQFVA